MTTAIALPATVVDLIDEYDAKVAGIDVAIAAYAAAGEALQMASTVHGCYAGQVTNHSRPFRQTVEASLLQSGWRAVYNRLGVADIISAKDKALWERTLANPPELTLDTAKATFSDYLMNPREHILRGLAEAFCALDDAYKSHSKVQVGVKGLPRRVILNNWGSFSSNWGRDRFMDMANALATYQRKPAVHSDEMNGIEKAHRKGDDAVLDGTHAVTKEGLPYPHRGMTVRKFQNGNAHVFFDADTCADINRALAEYYGATLPDAAPEGATPSASTAVAKDLQYYPTPQAVAQLACDFAGLEGPSVYQPERHRARKVLEPSCGDGRIMDAIRAMRHDVFGIEYDTGRAQQARAKGHAVLTANFLDQPATADFDTVVMNPPFYGRHYVKHVNHALGFLKPGGALVSILPATARYDHKELQGEWRDLPVGSFAASGTNIPTVLLKIIKREQS